MFGIKEVYRGTHAACSKHPKREGNVNTGPTKMTPQSEYFHLQGREPQKGALQRTLEGASKQHVRIRTSGFAEHQSLGLHGLGVDFFFLTKPCYLWFSMMCSFSVHSQSERRM